MHKHFQGVNGFGCGNKQDIPLFSAKTDVCCPVLRNGEMGYLVAILVEYGHTVACEIDVSPVVNRHPVRPHVGKYLSVRQVAVWLNVIS